MYQPRVRYDLFSYVKVEVEEEVWIGRSTLRSGTTLSVTKKLVRDRPTPTQKKLDRPTRDP